MKHKILLDCKNYSMKPAQKEIKLIQNRLHQYKTSLSIDGILKAAIDGYSFKLSDLDSPSKNSFVSTSLLAIDVDNKNAVTKKQSKLSVNFEAAKTLLEQQGIYIAGAYTTFSHTEKWPRFRLLIQLDRVITYLREADQLYMILKETFPFQDMAIHAGSMLFGGKEIIYSNDLAVTQIDAIFKIHQNKVAQSIDNHNVKPLSDLAAQSYITYIGNIDCAENLPSSENLSISRLRESFLRNILQYNQNNVTFDTFQAAITYVQQLPLDALLGLDKSCCCVVHHDKRQSAGVFQYEDGTYHYHCFTCGALMDVTDFIADFLGYDKEKEFMLLCNEVLRLFNIRIVDNKWKQGVERQIMLSKKNLKFIEKYKDTHKFVVRALLFSDSVYRLLMDECLISLEYVPVSDTKNLPLTRASLRYISKRTGLSLSQVRTRLERLQQAGFIRQLSDEETKLCSSYFGKSAHLQKTENHYTINTYAINYISDVTVGQAQFNLVRFKESGATTKSTSHRQSKYIGNNETCVKSKALESKRIQEEELILLEWATRTIKRNNCFTKEALIKYGLSKGMRKESIEKTITKITAELKLKRTIVSCVIIQKYGLPKSSVRKVVFIKDVIE